MEGSIRYNREIFEVRTNGVNILLNMDTIMDNHLSDVSKELLNEWISRELNSLLPYFKQIYEKSKTNPDFHTELHRKQDASIYKYTCLNRDFYRICSDKFDFFYDENQDISSFIRSIYGFNSVYNFLPIKHIEL